MARIIGTLFVGMFLALFITECVQKGRIDVASDRVAMTSFLFLSFVGLIAAWKWEGTGAAVALGSLVVFTILGLQTEGPPAGTLVVTVIYVVPALLFLLNWWRSRGEVRSAPGRTV